MDHVPQTTRQDVLRIIRREFPSEDPVAILEILDEYDTESSHGEPHRVHLAIMKLSGPDLGLLRAHLDVAKTDYRDVIAPAEYPRYSTVSFADIKEMDPREVRQLQEDDWKQYQSWLEAKQA